MAEYRRFISYIYAYEGDMKTKNVGFAKIEARGGQCRISISIKGAYECSGRELNLYGYGGSHGRFLLIPLGKIPVRSGIGEAVFGKQEDDLGGSGFSLGFVRGLYLRSQASARKSYLTTWDDSIVHISSLRNAPEAGKETLQETMPLLQAAELPKNLLGDQPSVVPEKLPETDEALKEKPEEKPKEKKDEKKEENTAEETEKMEKEPVPMPEKLPDDQNRWAQGNRENIMWTPSDRLEVKSETPEEIPGESEQIPGEPEQEAGESEQEAVAEGGMGEADARFAAPKKIPGEPEQETAAAAEAAEPEQKWDETFKGRMPDHFYYREGFMELPLWECLKKILPGKLILAESGWEVLQIQLQDIGRLPRENWPYGNNSFVLHGYYQYRYLILARRKREKREHYQAEYQYILGVPGIFKPQEKFMASMFGLPDFKRATGRREENFGFWCGSVKL